MEVQWSPWFTSLTAWEWPDPLLLNHTKPPKRSQKNNRLEEHTGSSRFVLFGVNEVLVDFPSNNQAGRAARVCRASFGSFRFGLTKVKLSEQWNLNYYKYVQDHGEEAWRLRLRVAVERRWGQDGFVKQCGSCGKLVERFFLTRFPQASHIQGWLNDVKCTRVLCLDQGAFPVFPSQQTSGGLAFSKVGPEENRTIMKDHTKLAKLSGSLPVAKWYQTFVLDRHQG